MPEENDSEEAAEEAEEEEYNPLDDPEYLEAVYNGDELVEGGATQAQIGEEHGVTSSTVSHYMKKHGIETRANTITDERLEDEEWLRNAYLGEEDGGEGDRMTMQDIADEIGCSDGTVMRRLHKFEIPVRRSATEGDDGEEAEDEEAEDEDEE